MNNAINMIVIVVMISLSLGFIVAIRVKRQFGFLAPLGFMCAAMLQVAARAAMLPMFSQASAGLSREALREVTSKLSDNDRLFYLGLGGQADGIWHLGAIFFLICGLLDLRAASGAGGGRLRYLLIVVGMLLTTFSTIYPSLMYARLR